VQTWGDAFDAMLRARQLPSHEVVFDDQGGGYAVARSGCRTVFFVAGAARQAVSAGLDHAGVHLAQFESRSFEAATDGVLDWLFGRCRLEEIAPPGVSVGLMPGAAEYLAGADDYAAYAWRIQLHRLEREDASLRRALVVPEARRLRLLMAVETMGGLAFSPSTGRPNVHGPVIGGRPGGPYRVQLEGQLREVVDAEQAVAAAIGMLPPGFDRVWRGNATHGRCDLR